MTALVSMQGIEKRFPGVHALKQASFELEAGEVHALMGENGAGKSTLMKILSGVYSKDAGSMTLMGNEVSFDGPRSAQDAGICIIHQELSLMNDLTVAQNIFIGREPRLSFGRLNDTALNNQAQEIFKQMNLSINPRTVVSSLTIAKQQMVEIAKALSYRSKILVMDEPTAALNDAEIADLFVIIEKLKKEGVGIIYISHKMDELNRIADRVTVMRDGETIDTALVATTSTDDIISMMVGRELIRESVQIPELSNAPIVLEVENLCRGKQIRNVSFDLRQGEILGFAGLMGAGRTEVARAIFGADKIDSGTIKVHGKTVNIKSPSDAVELGIGYLSEDRKHFGIATGMDVRANIAMASMKRFTSKLGVLNESAMRDVANEYIEKLDIRTPSDRQELRFLSGGNQQKVVIGKWLLRNSEVLIFDEPTRGIDVGAKAEIYKLLNQLAELGRSIIVISSELPEVIRLSHRIAVMCEGRLTGILPGGTSSQKDIMSLATDRSDQSHSPEPTGKMSNG